MKKVVIAGASAVLAAMPVVGAFAATEGSFKDTITVTVEPGCTIEVNGGTAGSYADRTFSATIAAGTTEELTGVEGESSTVAAAAMEVSCNKATPGQAWNIKATASNGGALKSGDDDTIPSGTDTSGTTSSFAYSINSGSTWLAVPTTANAAITSGTTVKGTPTAFNPIYRVYVAPGQNPGTYTGTITYTLALGA